MHFRSLVLVPLSLVFATALPAEIRRETETTFEVYHEVHLPVSPMVAWEAATGDISGWWDHTMSGDPHALVIEPVVGGLFREEFDAAGHGVVHARVIHAKPGERLTYAGPLGFNGYPLESVISLVFVPEKDGEGTLLKVICRGSGWIEEGWVAAIDQVMHHFYAVRLVGYLMPDAGSEDD